MRVGRVDGEQPGLDFGQDLSSDQAFEFRAHAFDVLRCSAEIEGAADVFGPERVGGVAQEGQDLLVGLAGDCRGGRADLFGGQAEQGLAGGVQVGQFVLDAGDLGGELGDLLA